MKEQQNKGSEENSFLKTKSASPLKSGAFNYLKSLPRRLPPHGLNSLRERDPSQIINPDTAQEFVEIFRSGSENINIPICWSFDKEALINLLGITSYEGYSEVNGVRFYAGVNTEGVLTLVAVSTTAGTRENCSDCRNDLTENEEYPFYDYADPCPSNCSDTGNLRTTDESMKQFARV